MIKMSEEHAEIFAAFIVAQSHMDGVKKNATKPHFKKKYADLGAVCDAVMDKLSAQARGVIQSPTSDENGVGVETMLVHAGGQWISGSYTLPLAKSDPQAAGSAITYARRYALLAIFGLAPEDDDGNAATLKKPIEPDAPRLTPENRKKVQDMFDKASDKDKADTALAYFQGKMPDPFHAELREIYHDAITRIEADAPFE